MPVSSRKWLLGIIIVSVLFRMGAAIYLGNQVEVLPGTFDQLSYHRLALRIMDGHGFSFGEKWWPITDANAPTAHWSYLYTLYLVVVYFLFGPNPIMARLLQAVLVGILLPWITYKIGRHIFDETVGLVAAGISAVYLYFIYYAATLMTESFYIVALLASFYLAMRLVEVGPGKAQIAKYALALGLTLGCAALLRQLSILFLPFLYLWVWWSGRSNGKKFFIPALALTTLVIAAMILPFTAYNYTRFERFVLLNTNSGYAFFWGNHPVYGTHFVPILTPEMGTYEGLIPTELHHLDEASLDQELLKRGIQFIFDDPIRYALLSLSRIPSYFMFWPSSDSGLVSNITRVFSFGLMLPLMIYGLFRAPYHPNSRAKYAIKTPVFLLLTFIFIYTLVHVMIWALIRYRLPIDAVLIIFAGFAGLDLWKIFIRSKIRHGDSLM